MIVGGSRRALSLEAVSRPTRTWVHPNARENVARVFLDTDLPTPNKEDIISVRRNLDPQPDDLADLWRCNDSLIASRERRRTRNEPTWQDYAMRAGLVFILATFVIATLVVVAVAGS